MAQLRTRRNPLERFPRPERPEEIGRWADNVTRALDKGLREDWRIIETTLNPAAVAANTTAEEAFTVATLTTSDRVFVSKPSLTAGVGIVNARVSAADTIAITFVNATGAPVNPASETYSILVVRSQDD